MGNKMKNNNLKEKKVKEEMKYKQRYIKHNIKDITNYIQNKNKE